MPGGACRSRPVGAWLRRLVLRASMAVEITELPPTQLVLPAAGELVHIRTQQWALERREGEDEPGLAVPWARKPKFSVNEDRSCAELAIVHHLQARGWNGVWVNAFRGELRTQWFPAPAARRGRRAQVNRGASLCDEFGGAQSSR